MGKDYTNKYISTVKHETLTNRGKIDSLDPLWSHYQNLLGQFMYDMNFHLVRGQEVLKYTKAKPYQGDMTVLFERAAKAYHKAVENNSELVPLEDCFKRNPNECGTNATIRSLCSMLLQSSLRGLLILDCTFGRAGKNLPWFILYR